MFKAVLGPKVILDHLGCSNKCFWPVLSPWCHVLAHAKFKNAWKMGRLGSKDASKWVKNTIFQK